MIWGVLSSQCWQRNRLEKAIARPKNDIKIDVTIWEVLCNVQGILCAIKKVKNSLQYHQCTAALSSSLDAPIIWSVMKGSILAYTAAVPSGLKILLAWRKICENNGWKSLIITDAVKHMHASTKK